MNECVGDSGRCGKPAKKAGLCWGHYERRRAQLDIDVPIRERASTPLGSLLVAAIAYQEQLDTATDEDWLRGRNRFLSALRRYLWVYVPALLKAKRYWSRFSPETRRELEEIFFQNYRDKSSHTQTNIRRRRSVHAALHDFKP